MSFAETVLLGAIAGFTIYLGLPVGRAGAVDARMRVGLAMFSVGLLAFIFMDVTSHAQELVDTALQQYKAHHEGFGHVLGLFALLAIAFLVGTAGIATCERRLRPRSRPPMAGADPALGVQAPGAVAAENVALVRSRALRTGMTIALAIGLHNFAEGLAIGVSARAGAISLATVLIIGFALHNATEGFGIVGPLGDVKPSWGWIGLAGLIGGGPTFLGSIVGYSVTSHPLELAFYATAGGAILYVIGEIWNGMRRYGPRELGLLMVSAGFIVGVITDLIVTYGGG